MGLRPGHCYASKKDRAFTRFAKTVPDKNYMGAMPGLKTRQFNMGNSKKQFSHILDLIVEEHVQIRDNAIESARITINRFLQRELGVEGYFMRIRVYPFQVLRENRQAQGAGADRVSQGMSLSFGTSIGRAVRTRPGQKIISVLVDEQNIPIAKQALLRANARIAAKLSVRIGTDVESIGTRPKKIKEIVEEKPKETTEKEAAKEGKKPAEGEKAAEGKKPATAKGQEAKKPEEKKEAAQKAKKK